MSDRSFDPGGPFLMRLRLARAALLWERVWPASWPVLAVLGSFLVLALFDLLSRLQGVLHAALLLGFGAALVIAVAAASRRFALPDRLAACRRIERASGGARLHAKVLDGKGGYDPGQLAIDRRLTLDAEQWDLLERLLDEAAYWELPTRLADGGGCDGDQLVEAGAGGGQARGPLGHGAVVEVCAGLGKSGTFGVAFHRPSSQQEGPAGRSGGSLSWAGLANTYFWVDPSKQVAGVILTQILPFADTKSLPLFYEFERIVYSTLSRAGI